MNAPPAPSAAAGGASEVIIPAIFPSFINNKKPEITAPKSITGVKIAGSNTSRATRDE